MAHLLLPRGYPEPIGHERLDLQVVERMEPALGLEPRTC